MKSLIIIYLVLSLISYFWIKKDELIKSDIIIVLEASSKLVLKSRLNQAYRLYTQKYAPKILLSGKKYVPYMLYYLKNKNVSEHDIILQNSSTNTYEDASYTFNKIGNITSLILVTSSFHQRRADYNFKIFFTKSKMINYPSSSVLSIFSFYSPIGWLFTLSEIIKLIIYNYKKEESK